MHLLEKELHEARDIWNTHLIRRQNAGVMSGIPDELYFLPEMRGKMCILVYCFNYTLIYIGYQDCSNIYDQDDMVMCLQHVKAKPTACNEFLHLTEILMRDEGLIVPNTAFEALQLYFKLVEIIKSNQ